MKMQNGFKDLTLFDLEGESKLYVVDSINNLHRANTCEDPCDPSSNPAAIKSTEFDPPPCSWHLKKIFLLAAVIVLLLVSFVLAAFAIFFIVRMENQLDYISTRVASEEKSIKEIKILMMNHFNFSKELNSSNVVGISPLSNTQSP
ncbi:leucine-rich single-pass membrane protein 1 isoform X2 [Scyliorhinus torazame]|uniref:leucine-rich single-pass membrane protein 1 isoform X2 n=1 Tax=Scyliorhinus torazame TaxID=75743 RepID=UPI003B5B0CDD